MRVKLLQLNGRSSKSVKLLICLMLLSGFSTSIIAQTNLLSDPGFESGSLTGNWGGAAIANAGQRTGEYALSIVNEGGLELQVNGLQPRTTYELEAWVKTTNGEVVEIGAFEFGGAKMSRSKSSLDYTLVSVRFSTGVTATSAKIYIYRAAEINNDVYVDDMSLTKINYEFDLIWNDEFSGNGSFDTTKWVSETGFQRNNEEQYYQASNSIQKDGNLVITGIRETIPNPDYDANSNKWNDKREYAYWTSGSLQTYGKKDFLYGRFEIRAKITNLKGTWPAIWTVGTEPGCGWPSSGEIDIMENYNGKLLANMVVANNGQWSGKWTSIAKSVTEVASNSQQTKEEWADEYHIWTLDWHEDWMAIYVDNVFMNELDLNSDMSFNEDGSTDCPGMNPFRTPQFLWINLALGGNAGGSTSGLPDSTIYLVDYARVYQKNLDNNLPTGGEDPVDETGSNKINDPGFETGSSSYLWGGSIVNNTEKKSGVYGAQLEDNSEWGGGYEAVITELSPNTTYSFSAWVKSSGGEGRIGAKDHGGDESDTSFSNSEFAQKSVEFTTGANNTSAKVYVYNPVGGAEVIYADDLELILYVTPTVNPINDPGFETGSSSYLWGGSVVNNTEKKSGVYGAQLEDNSEWGGGYEAEITELSPNTTYSFSAWVKSSGGEGRIGAKDHGGDESNTSFSNTEFAQKSVEFTTGANNTSAKVYVYNPVGGAEVIYADDLELVLSSSSARMMIPSDDQDDILNNKPLFSMYPNPTSGQVNVIFNIENDQTGTYSISTMDGRSVITKDFDKIKPNTLLSIDVSSLNRGIYILSIVSGHLKYSKQLVLH